jgi:23S rRNA (cytosine1962-C5)-methyltransferase
MPENVRVSRKAVERIEAGHPWVFASDVLSTGKAVPGAVVRVSDHTGRAIGTAHFSNTSQISLRMLSRRVIPVDHAFWMSRIQAAMDFRIRRGLQDAPAYRLVHAEADLLPGLIIDRYGDCFTIQTLDQGMDCAKAEIVSCLVELFSPRAIVERNDVAVREKEALPLIKGLLHGELPAEPLQLSQNGLIFFADLLHGQKTGVYLDQRENYLAAAGYARGMALDCFTSTGGFALHMSKNATHVEAVDSSSMALATAEKNRIANRIENVRFREADVFDLLNGYRASGKKFDTIVLDPPAFTHSRSGVEGAAGGYKDINLRAVQLLNPGGVLITCSCSFHMREALLMEAVMHAARDAGRALRVLERRAQSSDHPILPTVPETHYLKCFVFETF